MQRTSIKKSASGASYISEDKFTNVLHTAPCVPNLDYAVSYKDGVTRTKSINAAFTAPLASQRSASKYLAPDHHGKKLSQKKQQKMRDSEVYKEAAIELPKLINQHELLKVR